MVNHLIFNGGGGGGVPGRFSEEKKSRTTFPEKISRTR